MFDDAEELGMTLKQPDVSQSLQAATQAICDTFVQIAGELALNKVVHATNSTGRTVLDGVRCRGPGQAAVAAASRQARVGERGWRLMAAFLRESTGAAKRIS